MKPLIYVVEDDPSLQELYTYSLDSEFECICFDDGNSFAKALEQRKPALVLLDIMLPGEDGFTVLQRLKSSSVTVKIPVIIVSAKGEEISKVKGLNLGADDYIAKPFGVLELTARIKANLRKGETSLPVSAYKDLSIDNKKHTVKSGDVLIETTPKEYKLLQLLCDNAENVLTREEIFEKVWDEDFVGETRTLDIHIKQLRHKLNQAGSCVIIKTIRAIGYKMT